jgi:hypothetical protein
MLRLRMTLVAADQNKARDSSAWETRMMNAPTFRHGLRIFFLLALVNGCSSYPEARYYKAAGDAFADKEGLIPFALQGALVTLAPRPDPKQAQEDKLKQPEKQLTALGVTEGVKRKVQNIEGLEAAQVFATQMDAEDSLYFLEPKDSLLIQSNISVTYYDGHHRIKSIGTEFQDNRIKVVEAVGGTITALLPLLAFPGARPGGEEIELPLVFDFTSPTRFGARDTFTNWENVPNYKTWWYRYKVSQPTGRVFRTQEYFEKRKGNYTREFPMSACTDLTLEIGQGPDAKAGEEAKATYVLRVPDPSFVEPLPFPRKGTITSHTVCGADIASQPSQAPSDFAVLESIAKQVEAIWQAQRKKSDGDQEKTAGTASK